MHQFVPSPGAMCVVISFALMSAGCTSEVGTPDSASHASAAVGDPPTPARNGNATAAGPPEVPQADQENRNLLQRSPDTAKEHLEFREQLDQTLWSNEVAAQEHERPFVQLWDRLRLRTDRFEVLKEFEFSELRFRAPEPVAELDLGIRGYSLTGDDLRHGRASWSQWLAEMETRGYRIAQTEWHHAGFIPATEDAAASSLVSFVIDVERDAPVRQATIRGELIVRWSREPGPSGPVAETIETKDVSIWVRDAQTAFEEVTTAKTDPQHKRLMPLIVYDLDRDGLSEIMLGGLNRIYWNEGQGRFRAEPITPNLDIFDTGVVADFTGDGLPDFVCVGVSRLPAICVGKPDGRFLPPITCANVALEFPKSMTAGDIDGDGDLDLWIGQYKFPYLDGSMPTPFYDANDGKPSFLLRNDGTGSFEDVTETAGLASKRNRRTYSSSLVDLDDDGDLDLLTVNDFSGADVFRNDGELRFTDVTDPWLDQRHLFGMGHTLADFNLDARLDMYVIGMSSTTARRLDRLQLGRDDHPDVNRMRSAMGYGSRLLLRSTGDGSLYQQAAFNDRVARTGWSWGTTAFDFDNDGDRDIYVANGHNSGRSAQDYCTTYWCHDVYTGGSEGSQELRQLFRSSLRELHAGEISWNGFEHNVLMMNLGGRDFAHVGSLMGVALEYDSRGVVGEDLDADGRPDLLVVQYRSEGISEVEYTLHVLRNRLETNNHWIGVRLHESAEGPSPIGAHIIVKTPQRRHIHRVVTGDSFSSQHPTTAHFGLGSQTVVESVEVHWLDGSRSILQSPQPDRYYTIPHAQ